MNLELKETEKMPPHKQKTAPTTLRTRTTGGLIKCFSKYQAMNMGLSESAISYCDQALSFLNYDAFVYHALRIAFFKVVSREEAAKAWLIVLELDEDL